MRHHPDFAPRLYVGTYSKYNDGSLFGAWMDLLDYDSADDFHAACKKLHKDEDDPELMFQDYEGFPKQWYCECEAPKMVWELKDKLEDLDDDDYEAFCAFLDNGSHDVDDESVFDAFKEAYVGKFKNIKDFTYDIFKMHYGEAIEKAGINMAYIDLDYYWSGELHHCYWHCDNEQHFFRS